MGLRLKVSIIVASIWIGLFFIIFAYSKYTLTHDYKKLEAKELIADIERANKTLESLISSLKILTNDWSQWNDTYHFMEDKNQSFIKSNLVFTTFENAKVNLILFFDTAGELFFGLNYDLINKKFVPIPQNLLNYLHANKELTTHKELTSNKIGLLRIGEGYVVLSSLPILTSEGKGPIHGAIMMGYFFNNQHIAKLSEILEMRVHVYPFPIPSSDPTLIHVYNQLNADKYYTAIQNSDLINGYTFIYDINKKPIGILEIQGARTSYNEGMRTIEHYLAIIISISLIFLVSIWYLLKFFVLDRIISVSQQVIAIKSESKFSNRIKISSHDEIGNMVDAINSLMEIIELTQEQLKYRIVLRTEELEQLSKLNQNLYTEMTQQKQIEAKLRKDEKMLRHLAYYDYLTGLPNRVFFNDLLQKAISKSNKNGMGLTILFIDVDKFKEINDKYGHDIGDKFLQHTAHQLRSSIKDTDIVARLAGDEFIVCLVSIRGKTLITAIIEKLLSALATPLDIENIIVRSTYSIGVSIYPENGETVEVLEKHADLAMYYAKKQPGNAYYYYDEIEKIVAVSDKSEQ